MFTPIAIAEPPRFETIFLEVVGTSPLILVNWMGQEYGQFPSGGEAGGLRTD